MSEGYTPVEMRVPVSPSEQDVVFCDGEAHLTNREELTMTTEIKAMPTSVVEQYDFEAVTMDHPSIPADWTIRDLRANGPIRPEVDG